MACAGCSHQPEVATGTPAGSASAPGSPHRSTASGTPEPKSSSSSNSDHEPTTGPEAGSGDLQTPASTAGAISVRSFPAPRDLGHGWKYSVDPGNVEAGYLGNGTPALERDPVEVVQAAVPLGCRRATAMTPPTHALEVDYTYRGTKVVAIRGTFADASTAKSFFAARGANLAACQGTVSVPAEGVLVESVTRPAAGVLLSDRTPESTPWAELAVLDADAVVLVAAQGPLDRSPMRRASAAKFAAKFR
ncbi:MAG TPA: hypothetical protein VFG63_10735 [Nocardioidaceae bacterium]|nr:hypothetical protein [Nocardioidaceae bacterium]